jgi:hypothetical protein
VVIQLDSQQLAKAEQALEMAVSLEDRRMLSSVVETADFPNFVCS